MSDEFILSLRHSLDHVYSVARTLSWLHFIPLVILATAIFPLTGCGDKHENTPNPVRAVRYSVVGAAKTLPALERTGEIHAHDETTLSFRTGAGSSRASSILAIRLPPGNCWRPSTIPPDKISSTRPPLTMRVPKPQRRLPRSTSTECKR